MHNHVASRQNNIAHAVAWAMLLLFCLRALIPTGLMPQHQARSTEQSAWILPLTFCLPAAHSLQKVLSAQGSAPLDEPATSTVHECPFASLLAPVLLASAAVLCLFSQPLRRFAPTWVWPSSPAMPALGPPLGPRAPPYTFY